MFKGVMQGLYGGYIGVYIGFRDSGLGFPKNEGYLFGVPISRIINFGVYFGLPLFRETATYDSTPPVEPKWHSEFAQLCPDERQTKNTVCSRGAYKLPESSDVTLCVSISTLESHV